jgi:hypothetical protein
VVSFDISEISGAVFIENKKVSVVVAKPSQTEIEIVELPDCPVSGVIVIVLNSPVPES